MDEYQDINEAQDAILQALSREGPAANRFLVGDPKQSIYRFRLADPHIFQQLRRNLARRRRQDDSAGGQFSQPGEPAEFLQLAVRRSDAPRDWRRAL